MYLDYLVIIFYLLLIVLISFYARARSLGDMFVSRKFVPWWLASASLLMIWWNPAYDMMMMGILAEKGYSGSWILHSKLLTTGIAPIIFAPLWSRLRFMTDNQFILFRFSGSGARILHQFRAVYVGFFVVVFLISFGMIGMNKLWQLLFDLNYLYAQGLTFILLSLTIVKNAFQQKIRTDVLHAFLYFITPVAGCIFILQAFGGAAQVLDTLQSQYPQKVALVPDVSSVMGGETLPNFLVFVLIQWWSVNILDSSSPEAQRYMSTRNGWAAFKAAFLPVIVVAVMGGLTGLVQDTILLQHASQGTAQDTEALYLQSFLTHLPPGFRALAVLAFVMGFVTTIEALINWGASFLVVDLYKTYWKPQQSEKHYQYVSYTAMYLILIAAAVVLMYNDYMLGIQKFIFSITAGVGPVFILRWFWWRVNAWAQLAAMLGSLVFTLAFDAAFEHWPVFHALVEAGTAALQLDYYPFKIIILTVVVTFFWLFVMYMTPPDDQAHLQRFVRQAQPGGWWPKAWKSGHLRFRKKLWLIVLYAVVNVLPVFFIWELKFGMWWTGVILMIVFFLLVFVILKYMMSTVDQQTEKDAESFELLSDRHSVK